MEKENNGKGVVRDTVVELNRENVHSGREKRRR